MLVAMLAATTTAHAHSAFFESMDPPDGATITGPRLAASVTFSAPVQVTNLRIQMPDGRELRPAARTQGAVTTFTLPRPLEAGKATITWQVPQPDGHVVDYTRTYVYADSVIDPRVRSARSAIDAMTTALRAALTALR